jgi:hypothetical protein
MCSGTGKRDEWKLVKIDESATEDVEAFEDPKKRREPDPERLLLSRERSERTETAINLLASCVQNCRREYVQVIRGLFYNDETQDQIAERLGVDRSSVSRYKDAALPSLRFAVEPYRDGRNLGYVPSAAPPRRTGGAFALRTAQACGGFLALSASFPALIDGLDRDIQVRAKELYRRMQTVTVSGLPSICNGCGHFKQRPVPVLAARVLMRNGVRLLQAPSPGEVHCHTENGTGGEWPTRDWKRDHAEGTGQESQFSDEDPSSKLAGRWNAEEDRAQDVAESNPTW